MFMGFLLVYIVAYIDQRCVNGNARRRCSPLEMAPPRRQRDTLRQLTLEQSIRRSVAIGDPDTPGPSRLSTGTRRVTEPDSGSSSDDFSEPDPDSSDEWLPSGSTASSRASSPDATPQTRLPEAGGKS